MKDGRFYVLGGGVVTDDAIPYVKEYVAGRDGVRVYVGSDSKVRSGRVIFATAICLYTPMRGAHVIHTRVSERRERFPSLRARLMREVTDTINMAFDIREALDDEVGLEAHFDISPDEANASSVAYRDAVGYAAGMELRFRTKPSAASFAATCAADQSC